MMNYQNKKCLVVGVARSGIGAAILLNKVGAVVTLNDSKPREQLKADLSEIDRLPITLALGVPAAQLLEGQDVLVISPGIPDTAPFVKQAKEMGLYVTGELELAFQLCPCPVVALTGTNGKTTTTTLVNEMFKNAGYRSFAVGNIGESFAGAVAIANENDRMVVEVSSFQMETAETFHPCVSALLNITEDHLNRHGTMEVYTDLKMRVFAKQTAEDTAVMNADDPALAPLYSRLHSRVLSFSRKKEVEKGAFVRDGMVILRTDAGETAILPADEIFIPGPHNLENALAAICMAAPMGIPAEVMAHTLRTFKGVEHRIEFVRELNGIRYYNDSKGTNVDSTLCAVRTMQTMNRPTAIILGGSDKHCDFTPLALEMLASPCIHEAVLIGVTAPQLERQLSENGFTHITRCETFEQAILTCRDKASEGWNVLLSPACASFDMFTDYENRGHIFKDIVNQLN